MPTPATTRTDAGAQALLICPDQTMCSELAPLVSHVLPGLRLTILKQYPDPGPAVGLAGGVHLCFVDADSDERRSGDLIRQLQQAAPSVQVIALLSNKSPDRILQCLRQGASEFLIRPFTTAELEPVLERVAQLSPAQARRHRARIILVAPVKGSCGASTLAATLAFQRKRLEADKMLLVDLDPLAGTLAFQLKLNAHFNFTDVLSRASALDQDLWRATVARCGELDVLLAPENPVDVAQEFRDPTPILQFARGLYDAIVVDCAGVFSDWFPLLAALSDHVLVVTTAELPSLLATQKALAYLHNAGIAQDQLRLIVNRYSRDAALSKDAIAAALQAEVYEFLPADFDAIRAALVDGKTVSPASPLGKAVATLAGRLSGHAPAAGRSRMPFLGGILRSFFSKATP